MYGTFNGWKRQGRVVAIGEKAFQRNEWGDKLFHFSQTVPRGYPMDTVVVRRPRVVYSYY